eukprot:SM000122S25779  [mRNA]  locus=s122:194125:198208:- [translate_table: standard]
MGALPVMYGRLGAASPRHDHVVKLDQIPKWADQEQHAAGAGASNGHGGGPPTKPGRPAFLNAAPAGELHANTSSPFPVNPAINSRLHIWRGAPWPLEVDAVVNTTNEALEEAHSSLGLHVAAGPGLAEECAALGGCRTGEAKLTGAHDLPAKWVIHTVGPRYAQKYHTAAENALSHCYRSCLELLIENELKSIAFECIYTEAKGYPREPAAHVAISELLLYSERCAALWRSTTRKSMLSSSAPRPPTTRRSTRGRAHNSGSLKYDVVMTRRREQSSSVTSSVEKIQKLTMSSCHRLLPLYFPRMPAEEELACIALPADVGDDNGETTIDERKIRISVLPGALPISSPAQPTPGQPVMPGSIFRQASGNSSRLESIDSLTDPMFTAMIRDPDQRRKEQWDKAAQARADWSLPSLLGLGSIGRQQLTAVEEDSLHSRYMTKANALDFTEIAEMKILYRGGHDREGRPLLVVVGAHFLSRSLDLGQFMLYVLKVFEPVIQKPYTIVYFHSAVSMPRPPDLAWVKTLQQILGRKHRRNLHALHVVHPNLALKLLVVSMQLFVEQEVWTKVYYKDRLWDLFRVVARDQITIPDFVFQQEIEEHGSLGQSNQLLLGHS